MSKRRCQPLQRFLADRLGASAVEASLIATLLVSLMLGAYDFGNAAQQQIQLQEAVRSGGGYAKHWPTDVIGIRNAVASALPNGWTLTNPGGVATVACSCLDPPTGAVTAVGGCTPAQFDGCPQGSGILVSVTATMAYVAVDHLFDAVIPELSATYAARIY